MSYVISDVPLISQKRTMACWFASANMLVTWRRERTQMCETGRPTPYDVPDVVALQQANNGLGLGQMMAFSKIMGLATMPPMSPTLRAIEDWLRTYGPIWAAGRKITASSPSGYGHVVAIVGVRDDQILIHDPEPVNVGSKVWQPESWLASFLTIATDTIPTNFMYYQ